MMCRYHPYLTHTLAKWSAKVAAVAPSALLPSSRNAFSVRGGGAVKDIGVQIDDVLNADGAKLIGRTRVRRCKGARVHISVQSHEAEREAATESDPGVDGDTEVFDDTDF